MQIHIREGLSVTNGTSVMTGIGIVNQFYAERLLDWATLASVMMNEIAASYDDFMAQELNECRRQEGTASHCPPYAPTGPRRSTYAETRARTVYQWLPRPQNVDHTRKVQAYYSFALYAPVLGPVYETLQNARRTSWKPN